ncbi:aldo/keto reductase [Pararhodospirillum oryzae]|uniref:Oxidoreductase n=1 Tax=Pararhodospirillum oryzae TaxID=478448 RepID=A0A512H8X9_9PROT|nr:aldo/keto reductase [Pararhodospirillum oryzae]GEO81882.1 oxidoreductase [Pararhodospirillum oryzae]
MRYTTLGNTGLVVSRLGFGAMTFGSGTGPMASVFKIETQGTADRLVGRALEAGVTLFNTADAYAGGASETMLGHALGRHRSEVVIATKVGFRTGPALGDSGLSRRHILAAAEASLRRLGTDWIDVYLAHRVDPHTPLEETLDALETLIRQGKVRYAGFSNWPAWLAAKAVGLQRHAGARPFCAAEMYYSLVGRDVEHEVVPFARDAGIGLMVWSPLAGGFLSGRYTPQDPTGDGGRLAGFDILPVDRDKGFAILEVLGAVARAHDVSVAAVAIAWLLTRPGVASVLLGASRIEHLDQTLAAASLDLSAETLQALDAASAIPRPYPAWFVEQIGDEALKAALEG